MEPSEIRTPAHLDTLSTSLHAEFKKINEGYSAFPELSVSFFVLKQDWVPINMQQDKLDLEATLTGAVGG